MTLAARITAARSGVARAEGTRDALRKQAEEARSRVSGINTRSRDLETAHALLTSLAESRRKETVERVERVVTAALRSVFGPDIEYRITVKVSRGVVSMFGEVGKMTNRGLSRKLEWFRADSLAGGVVDVLSFAIRAAVLMLHRPRLRPILIADEPFKHVSERHLPAVAKMLETVARESGLQLIVISHEPQIADCAGRVFTVDADESGYSEVDIEHFQSDPTLPTLPARKPKPGAKRPKGTP